MTISPLTEKLARAFTAAEWEHPGEDFVPAAMSLLSQAIARLPTPEKREEALLPTIGSGRSPR